uniref:DUF721 domain-containing protein n=1 Tax=Thaumasiovibrio occultus TaxID=1891184 RepID=UPI000B357140|nr:DciA family protein [Thaumasiovibrio occultus]
MRDHRPQGASHLLERGTLSEITERAKLLDQLGKKVKSCVSPSLGSHLRIANYRDGLLILEVSSPSWAQRVNFERFTIMEQLRRDMLPSLTTIEVKVNPAMASAVNNPRTEIPVLQQVPISSVAADYLDAVAEGAPDKIKARLKRLAAMGRKQDT